jgi:hypothetical protein
VGASALGDSGEKGEERGIGAAGDVDGGGVAVEKEGVEGDLTAGENLFL